MNPYSHSQNLNEKGSKFWHGRAWYHAKREWRAEWVFGRRADSCTLRMDFGEGDSDDGVMLIFCIPFIVNLYLSVTGIWRCKPWQSGLAIHNNAFWFYPMPWSNESNSKDPWYRKNHCWDFPWVWKWLSTEILNPFTLNPVWTEIKKHKDIRENMAVKEQWQQSHPYTYTLKSGEVQVRIAKINVERRTWRAKWWPLIPITKVRTTIDVHFDKEVGEETGSWKGGCTGCGYEMKVGETPLATLRRMEKERKF